MSRLIWVVCFSLLPLMVPAQVPPTSSLAPAQVPPTSSPAPAPSPSAVDCSQVIYDMTDCLTYVTVPSNDTTPSSDCCTGVVTVVNTSPTCLCAALKEASDMGLTLNMTRAVGLPAACSLSAPQINCSTASPPGLAPAPSEPSPPESSPVPSPPPESMPPSPPAPVIPSPISIPPAGSPASTPEMPPSSPAMELSASRIFSLAGLPLLLALI